MSGYAGTPYSIAYNYRTIYHIFEGSDKTPPQATPQQQPLGTNSPRDYQGYNYTDPLKCGLRAAGGERVGGFLFFF